MTEYSAAIRTFEAAYQAAILDYTKNHMTLREKAAFNTVLVQCRQSMGGCDNNAGSDFVGLENIATKLTDVDIEQRINQCRNLDPEGWLVFKCNFVEDYMNTIADDRELHHNASDTLCLCDVDEATSSGTVICPGISRTRYTEFMMDYTPTWSECEKISQLPAPLVLCQQMKPATSESHGECGTLYKIEDAELILRSISGRDAKGWLHHKHLFIQKELAAAAKREASDTQPLACTPPISESVVHSAVTDVLRRVRNDVHAEISLHCADHSQTRFIPPL